MYTAMVIIAACVGVAIGGGFIFGFILGERKREAGRIVGKVREMAPIVLSDQREAQIEQEYIDAQGGEFPKEIIHPQFRGFE